MFSACCYKTFKKEKSKRKRLVLRIRGRRELGHIGLPERLALHGQHRAERPWRPQGAARRRHGSIDGPVASEDGRVLGSERVAPHGGGRAARDRRVLPGNGPRKEPRSARRGRGERVDDAWARPLGRVKPFALRGAACADRAGTGRERQPSGIEARGGAIRKVTRAPRGEVVGGSDGAVHAWSRRRRLIDRDDGD